MYNTVTNEILLFKHKNSDIQSISEFQGKILVEDRSGTYWFATGITGVNYFNLAKAQFELFQHDDSNPESLMTSYVWGICEDHKGRIWIGADGLNMYNPITRKFYHFSDRINPKYKYLSGIVKAISEITPNNYFVAVQGRVIWYKYDNEELTYIRDFIPDHNNPNSMVAWSPFSIFKDSKTKFG